MKTENSVKVLLPLGLHTPEMKEKIVEMLNGREGMFKGSVKEEKGMKKGMTHEEHLDLAKALLLIDKLINDAGDTIGQSYGYSSRESKATGTLRKKLESLRSMLDTRYHKVTTDEQFLKQGHVYFGERPKTEAGGK